MLRFRRAKDRPPRDTGESWFTSESSDPALGPPALVFQEGKLPPRAAVPERSGPYEILTYVREGSVAFEDSLGHTGLIEAGQFQRMTAGPDVRYREGNASPTRWAHVYQLWLRLPDAGRAPGYELKRFSAARRRGRLCVVASPDGRSGSLELGQDALLFSAILEPGRHLIHELTPGRDAWLHVVAGELGVRGLPMTAGDAVAIVDEPAVSMTCVDSAEILLLEVDAPLAIA